MYVHACNMEKKYKNDSLKTDTLRYERIPSKSPQSPYAGKTL